MGIIPYLLFSSFSLLLLLLLSNHIRVVCEYKYYASLHSIVVSAQEKNAHISLSLYMFI